VPGEAASGNVAAENTFPEWLQNAMMNGWGRKQIQHK
jgi:hypothetical protein